MELYLFSPLMDKQLSLIQDSTVEGCNKHMFVAMIQECLKVSHSGVTTGKEYKSGLKLQ